MFSRETTLDSPTGARLHLYERYADGRARGIVLVQHGLAEHAGRYGRLAARLGARGFHVYAHDHRGHGRTTAPDAPFRRFAGRDGADRVLADARAVHRHAAAAHPGLPVVVFGHSMGAMVALNYAERHGAELAGLAAWNADLRPGAAARIGRWALKVEKALKGSDVASALMQRATFDAWARSVTPRRTGFDWLSHDEGEVDAYLADPLCGFSPTVSMMEDVLAFILKGGSRTGLSALPRDLPVHLLGGTADPASENGEAVRWLAGRLDELGKGEVTLHLVDRARHETLNEIEPYREEATAALLAWLDAVVPAASASPSGAASTSKLG